LHITSCSIRRSSPPIKQCAALRRAEMWVKEAWERKWPSRLNPEPPNGGVAYTGLLCDVCSSLILCGRLRKAVPCLIMYTSLYYLLYFAWSLVDYSSSHHYYKIPLLYNKCWLRHDYILHRYLTKSFVFFKLQAAGRKKSPYTTSYIVRFVKMSSAFFCAVMNGGWLRYSWPVSRLVLCGLTTSLAFYYRRPITKNSPLIRLRVYVSSKCPLLTAADTGILPIYSITCITPA
jgi:hypothetical protein